MTWRGLFWFLHPPYSYIFNLIANFSTGLLNIEDDLSNLFVNSQGIMVGNGEIWFDPAKGGIFAFNS